MTSRSKRRGSNVQHRTMVCDPNTLGPVLVERLVRLTNDRVHDLRDDGSPAGSVLRKRLLAFQRVRTPFPEESWAVLAVEVGSLDPHVVGWGLVVPRPYEDSQANVAFYVDPTKRRMGVARTLLARTVEVSRERGVTVLRGEPWNRRSAAFFAANGFATVVSYVSGETMGLAELTVEQVAAVG